MKETTIIIPNYNGIQYLEKCICSLIKGESKEENGMESDKLHALFDILVVDNGSSDGSEQVVEKLKKERAEHFPHIGLHQIRLDHNTGFCGAVNIGIREAKTPYVLLLNNDTEVLPGFVSSLTRTIASDRKLFSVSAKMLSMKEPEKMDDAGDFYCALGWAFARGKGRPASDYAESAEIFAACGGAAIYRREVFEQLGLLDENHFAYLEDIDVAYRAQIHGYRNQYEPSAAVLHAGSATTGSAHNPFKVRLSARNSVYLAYKNMPLLQLLLNLPFLLCGHFIKLLYFAKKHLAGPYLKGLGQGITLCLSKEGRAHKIPFRLNHLLHYVRIQYMLWWNIVRRLGFFH